MKDEKAAMDDAAFLKLISAFCNHSFQPVIWDLRLATKILMQKSSFNFERRGEGEAACRLVGVEW